MLQAYDETEADDFVETIKILPPCIQKVYYVLYVHRSQNRGAQTSSKVQPIKGLDVSDSRV